MKQFVLPFEPACTGDEPFTLCLDGTSFHYLVRVRRCRTGDQLIALSPSGQYYGLVVQKIEKNCCYVELFSKKWHRKREETPDTLITLIPALMKGRKMDLVVRQSVETGVFTIWPVQTEHSQVRLHNSDKIDRWKRIAKEALQQCGGTYSTAIEAPAGFKTVMERWANRGPVFFLHEKKLDNNKGMHHNLAEDFRELALLVGPEGGFSDDEVYWLETLGAKGVFLGSRVLRAETAVLYGIAALATIIREKTQWKPYDEN